MKISSGGWKIRVNWSREKRKSFSQSFDTAPTLRALILKDSLIRDLRQVDRSDEEKVFLSSIWTGIFPNQDLTAFFWG